MWGGRGVGRVGERRSVGTSLDEVQWHRNEEVRQQESIEILEIMKGQSQMSAAAYSVR